MKNDDRILEYMEECQIRCPYNEYEDALWGKSGMVKRLEDKVKNLEQQLHPAKKQLDKYYAGWDLEYLLYRIDLSVERGQ